MPAPTERRDEHERGDNCVPDRRVGQRVVGDVRDGGRRGMRVARVDEVVDHPKVAEHHQEGRAEPHGDGDEHVDLTAGSACRPQEDGGHGRRHEWCRRAAEVLACVPADVVARTQYQLSCQYCADDEERHGPPLASGPLEALVPIENLDVVCCHAITDEVHAAAGDRLGRSEHATQEAVAVDQLMLQDQPEMGSEADEECDVAGDMQSHRVLGDQHQPEPGERDDEQQ